MLPGLPFANIAHLGWAVRDIDTTVKNFEDLGPDRGAVISWEKRMVGMIFCAGITKEGWITERK